MPVCYGVTRSGFHDYGGTEVRARTFDHMQRADGTYADRGVYDEGKVSFKNFHIAPSRNGKRYAGKKGRKRKTPRINDGRTCSTCANYSKGRVRGSARCRAGVEDRPRGGNARGGCPRWDLRIPGTRRVARPVAELDAEGNAVARWPSITACSRDFPLSASTISRLLREVGFASVDDGKRRIVYDEGDVDGAY